MSFLYVLLQNIVQTNLKPSSNNCDSFFLVEYVLSICLNLLSSAPLYEIAVGLKIFLKSYNNLIKRCTW